MSQHDQHRQEHHHSQQEDAPDPATAVLEVSGVQWATSKNVAETVLGRRPGVLSVDANPVSQTATVTYDPARSDLTLLRSWVRDCGCHGRSVGPEPCV